MEYLIQKVWETLLNLQTQGASDAVIQTEIRNLLSAVVGKTRTANMLRVISNGTIPGTPYSFSVANVGSADGVLLGAALKVGENVNLDAGDLGNIFAAGSLTYDATGTEFLIIYIS